LAIQVSQGLQAGTTGKELPKRAHALRYAGQLSRRGKRGQQQGDSTMQADVLFRILKGASWAVIALMLISIAYATFTSIRYWAGIGV